MRPRNTTVGAAGRPGSGCAPVEAADLDAVRDEHRVPAEVLDDHAAGGRRHRDAAGDLLERRAAARCRTPAGHGYGPSPCGTSRPSGRSRRSRPASTRSARSARAGAGRRRRPRAASAGCGPARAGRRRAGRRSRCTAPAPHDRRARRTRAGRPRRGRRPARAPTPRARARRGVGEVADVRLHPAGDVPGVRADDADPHARAARRGSSAARSSSHSRCSMCQSAGCCGDARRRRRRRAPASWSATSVCGTGSCHRMRQPSSGERQGHRQQRGAGRAAPAWRGRRASGPLRRTARRRRRGRTGRGRRAGTACRRPRAARRAPRRAAARRRSAAAPPCRATRGRRRSGRRATRARSRSATVVKGTPVAPHHAPAWSQLPLCGSAMTAPRPAGERVAQPLLTDQLGPPDRPARSA